jgi:site-specific recombinase XerD
VSCGDCGATPVYLRGWCHTCFLNRYQEKPSLPCPRCNKPGIIRHMTGLCGTCTNNAHVDGRTCLRCGDRQLPIIARGMCESCYRRIAKQETKRQCPGCDQKRLITSPLGLCDRCATRTLFHMDLCAGCGRHTRIAAHGLCAPCRLRRRESCPSCGAVRVLHPEMNLCWRCLLHPGSIGKSCVVCGKPGRVPRRGMCSRCKTHDPDWPFDYGERLIARLEAPPDWLDDFVTYAAARFCPQTAMKLLHELGRLLSTGPGTPGHLLERARKPGRSVGALALTLEGFFVQRRLALPLDQPQRRARARLERVIQGVPITFRDAVAAFCEAQLADRRRGLRVGTRPLSDHSIDVRVTTMRDFARFLVERRSSIDRWELVDEGDVERFLGTFRGGARGHLPALRAFFRWARSRKLVLVDPTRRLKSQQSPGYRGKLIDHQTQRSLYQRWVGAKVHPNEAFVGLMALLHGTTVSELRYLRVDDVDAREHAIRLTGRSRPLPLDPATWTALDNCLCYRQDRRTQNPHLLITYHTASRNVAVSPTYLHKLLKPAGVSVQALRCTRLAGLTISIDPKLVSEVFGLAPHSLLHYLADTVDATRLEKSAAGAPRGKRPVR